MILFGLEFIEGNTITWLYFMRLRRLARLAVTEGRVTPELARARAEHLASFMHFARHDLAGDRHDLDAGRHRLVLAHAAIHESA